MSALEADIAFFDAKLSLLQQQPSNPYLKAQARVYQVLTSVLSSNLVLLSRRRLEPGMGTIEVMEVGPLREADRESSAYHLLQAVSGRRQ